MSTLTSPWVLTKHALMRAEVMGLNHAEVVDAIENCVIDQPAQSPDLRMAKNGTVAVVYNPERRTIVTILHHTTEPYRRAQPRTRKHRRRPNPEGR